MWVSPNHPNPPRACQAPADDGEPLGSFPRGDGRDELRVTLKTYEGKPYVSIRVWSRDERGQFWPVKNKGCSVRLPEVAGVCEALQAAFKAVKELTRESRPERPAESGRRSPRPGDRPQRQDYREANLPRQGGSGSEFDEFSES